MEEVSTKNPGGFCLVLVGPGRRSPPKMGEVGIPVVISCMALPPNVHRFHLWLRMAFFWGGNPDGPVDNFDMSKKKIGLKFVGLYLLEDDSAASL